MIETCPVPDPAGPTSGDGRSTAVLYGVVLALGIALAGWLGSCGFPCPTSDDAFYRSPAAELVQGGRLAIPSVGTFLPRTEAVFACHPPLYQLLLGGWYLAFGVSLRSSLAFTYTVHLLNALAVMAATRRALAADAELTAPVRRATIAAVGLIQVANLAYFDRQEETALLWIWLDVLRRKGPGVRQALTSGLLLGLAGLTSEWVGLLGAMLLTFRTVFTTAAEVGCPTSSPFRAAGGRPCATGPAFVVWARAGLRLGTTALVASTLVGSWAVLMESRYPGIIDDQFLGLMAHIAGHQGPPSPRKNLEEFAGTLLFNRPQLPVLLLTLALFPTLLFSGARSRRVSIETLALFAAGVCGIGLIAVVRPGAYTYLGAVQILLLPCFGPAIGRYSRGPLPAAWFGLGILALCTGFASQQAAALAVSTWTLPRAERCDAVCWRLNEIIPPGDLVDVTGRHWNCFQGRNPWYEAYFLRDEPGDLLRSRWLVLATGKGAPSCIDGFELVEEVPSTADPDRTYAYSLWRRREK